MRNWSYLLIAIFALFLYLFIPYGYNTAWCIVCFVLFIYISVDLLKDDFKEKEYVSFNSIFLVSFFLTSFVFPVFIISSDTLLDKFVDMNYLVQFVDFKYLSRGVFLCLLAIAIYALAYKAKTKRKESVHVSKRNFRRLAVDAWLTIAILLTIYNAFFSYQTYNVTNLQQSAYVYDILKASLIVSFLAHIPKLDGRLTKVDKFGYFIKNNMYPLIISGIAILLFLYFGVRNLAISVFLIVIITMAVYYSRISLKYIMILGIVGTIALFVIRETRHSESSIMNSNVSSAISSSNIRQTPVLFLFSDLIGACQELSLGVEIKDKTGYQNPEQIILLPFLPFPKLPSLISDMLWNESYQEATAATILNDYMLTTSNKSSTYGKHCVSDLYMKWGVIGIIVFFYLLGRIVSSANKRKWSNYYSAGILITLVSLSLFLARGSLIDLIRPISYTCLFILIFSRKQTMQKL